MKKNKLGNIVMIFLILVGACQVASASTVENDEAYDRLVIIACQAYSNAASEEEVQAVINDYSEEFELPYVCEY